MATPATDEIWKDLRKRYKIKVTDFVSQKDLLDFLEKRKSAWRNIARSNLFWSQTKSMQKALLKVRTLRSKPVKSYTKKSYTNKKVSVKSYKRRANTPRWGVVETEKLIELRNRYGRDTNRIVKEFRKTYKIRTKSAITTKLSRLKRR